MRIFLTRLELLALIAVIPFSNPCRAQVSPSPSESSSPAPSSNQQQSQLEEINQKVQQERARLSDISLKQQQVLDEISQLRNELENLKKMQSDSELELTRVLATRESTEKELKTNQNKIETLNKLSLTRLRSVYMITRQPQSQWSVLLDPQMATHFSRNAWYMSKIRTFDQQLFKRMGELQQDRSKRLAELQQLGKSQDLVLKKIAEQKKNSELKLNQRNNLVKTLNQQKLSTQEALRSLQSQAQRLETVVASLTGGQQLQPPPSMITASRIPEKIQATPSPAPSLAPEGFKGLGLAKLKGLLPNPVKGQITRRFGKQKDQDFEDFVFNKGLEFLVSAENEVHAIADGVVLHLGNMPGYGIILILDHGDRYYSLYGRLASVKVKVGDIVKQEEVISALADQGAERTPASSDKKERGNFYFEIRKDGQPVDPALFLKKSIL